MAASFQQKRTTASQKPFLRRYLTAFSPYLLFGTRVVRRQSPQSAGRGRHLLLLLCRREGGNDFFEARIATQGVPVR